MDRSPPLRRSVIFYSMPSDAGRAFLSRSRKRSLSILLSQLVAPLATLDPKLWRGEVIRCCVPQKGERCWWGRHSLSHPCSQTRTGHTTTHPHASHFSYATYGAHAAALATRAAPAHDAHCHSQGVLPSCKPHDTQPNPTRDHQTR